MANKAYICNDKEVYFPLSKDRYVSIRPVSKEKLDELQSLEGCKAYNKDVWKQAVQYNDYEESLEDFCQSLLDDWSGDENYPFKDDSDIDRLEEIDINSGKTLREVIDAKMMELFNIEVGTWEASGSGFFNDNEKENILAEFTYRES